MIDVARLLEGVVQPSEIEQHTSASSHRIPRLGTRPYSCARSLIRPWSGSETTFLTLGKTPGDNGHQKPDTTLERQCPKAAESFRALTPRAQNRIIARLSACFRLTRIGENQ